MKKISKNNYLSNDFLFGAVKKINGKLIKPSYLDNREIIELNSEPFEQNRNKAKKKKESIQIEKVALIYKETPLEEII